MKKMSPVVHFEMPADDKERVASFYRKAFGWDVQIMGEEYGGYILATTTESDEKGPKKPGAINGGFWLKEKDKPKEYPHVVISVENLQESIKEVADAGGKIIGEQMDIPGVGLYISFEDTEGNTVGMLQPADPNEMKR